MEVKHWWKNNVVVLTSPSTLTMKTLVMFHLAELTTPGLSPQPIMSHNDDSLHNSAFTLLTKWQDPRPGQHPVSPEASLLTRTHSPRMHTFCHLGTRTLALMPSLTSLHATCYYTWHSHTCAQSRSNAEEEGETSHVVVALVSCAPLSDTICPCDIVFLWAPGTTSW